MTRTGCLPSEVHSILMGGREGGREGKREEEWGEGEIQLWLGNTASIKIHYSFN